MGKKIKKKKKSNLALYVGIFVIVVLFAVFGLVLSKPHKQASAQSSLQPPQAQKPAKASASSAKAESRQVYQNFPKYKFSYKYKISVTGPLKTLYFSILVPQKETDKQYFENLKINIKPTKLSKENGNLKAEFSYENIDKQDIVLEISGIAYVRTYNLKTAKSLQLRPKTESDLSRYLKSEPLIESDYDGIIAIAQKIQGNTREEILDNIYKFVQDNLKYQRISGDIGAKQALMGGFGKCSEYAAVMTALCRAKNIPARIVSGNFARENDTKHTWVEVYFDDYGWVTYDPTITPTKVTTQDANGRPVKTEYRYDTSHDNIQYIKSANDVFSTFYFKYTKPSSSNGNVLIQENISIRKL